MGSVGIAAASQIDRKASGKVKHSSLSPGAGQSSVWLGSPQQLRTEGSFANTGPEAVSACSFRIQ